MEPVSCTVRTDTFWLSRTSFSRAKDFLHFVKQCVIGNKLVYRPRNRNSYTAVITHLTFHQKTQKSTLSSAALFVTAFLRFDVRLLGVSCQASSDNGNHRTPPSPRLTVNYPIIFRQRRVVDSLTSS